jgi:dsDNA-specific endonuclease/ATPase MutS2
MTGDNNLFEKLNDELSDQATKRDEDVPEWAEELAAQVEANRRAVEAYEQRLEERRQAAAEEVLSEAAEMVEQNSKRIEALASVRAGDLHPSNTQRKRNGSSDASDDRKYSKAWDDTLEVE